jgi:hypothetical protein
MRTGIWFPVSSELIGFAFLLAIIVLVIYVIFKSAQKSVEQSEKRNIESNFFNESTNLLAFGFPTKSETVFKDKFISADKGIAFLKTTSRAGISLCSHAKLHYTRLYFFVDFSFFDRTSAIIYLLNEDNEKAMLKINAETAMLSIDEIRFFEINPKHRNFFSGDDFSIEIDKQNYQFNKSEKLEIKKAIDFVVNLSEHEGNLFKQWRKLK